MHHTCSAQTQTRIRAYRRPLFSWLSKAIKPLFCQQQESRSSKGAGAPNKKRVRVNPTFNKKTYHPPNVLAVAEGGYISKSRRRVGFETHRDSTVSVGILLLSFSLFRSCLFPPASLSYQVGEKPTPICLRPLGSARSLAQVRESLGELAELLPPANPGKTRTLREHCALA